MLKTSPQQRSDPKFAAEVIDFIFRGVSAAAKRSYRKFLTTSVEYLSQHHSDGWGVTLLNRGIRLSAGWVECLVIHPDCLRVLVEEDSAPNGTKFDAVVRRWAPGCRYTLISLPEIPRVRASLEEAHLAALGIAAKARSPHSNIRTAHSPGITKLWGLSNPSYFMETAVRPGVGSEDTEPTRRRYWTSYWKEQYWAGNVEYKPVVSSGSGSILKRGVKSGDAVYVVSSHAGQLLLGGRMTVGRIVSRKEAAKIRKVDDLYHVDKCL